MAQRQGAPKASPSVTFKGNRMTLGGTVVKEGQRAPDFAATATDMSTKRLSDYQGKTVLIVAVPSLDTPVCDVETRRFNQEAGKLGPGVVVLVVSMDLPFAQKRWCGAAGVEHVVTLSDYKDREFAKRYGLYVKELGLLARAVMVVDRKGEVKYVQVVPEITQEPDYEAALAAARAAA